MRLETKDLAGLSFEEISAKISEWFVEASSEEAIQQTECFAKQEIEAFECHYGISSKQMLEKCQSGELEETEDICTWLMLMESKT